MIFKFQAIGQLNACSIWTDWKTFKACGPVNGKFAYQRTMVMQMSHQDYREIAKIAFLRETFLGLRGFLRKGRAVRVANQTFPASLRKRILHTVLTHKPTQLTSYAVARHKRDCAGERLMTSKSRTSMFGTPNNILKGVKLFKCSFKLWSLHHFYLRRSHFDKQIWRQSRKQIKVFTYLLSV